jgi:hypothetical protein
MSDWDTILETPLDTLINASFEKRYLPGVYEAISKYMADNNVYVQEEGSIDTFKFEDIGGARPTRQLSQYLYEKYKIHLAEQHISWVGNIVDRYTLYRESIIFSITNSFDWDSGDFGDSGSCFWGDCEDHKELLEASGGMAFRIHDPDCPRLSEGLGRCWLYPTRESGFITAFNGYGINLTRLTNYMSAYFNLLFRDIRLSSSIFINNDHGVLLGTGKRILKITKVNHAF